ncbi:MAG: Uncharacterised protein [SAR116 cluster bacterium]|nr:MAG: Uncharacterised protein [SAR116 cluster bacterium]
MLDTGKRDAFINHIDGFQPVTVKTDDAACGGIDIDPPRRGHRQPHRGWQKACCQLVGGAVLIHISGFQPRDNDRFNAGVTQPVYIGLCESRALANTTRLEIDGMHQHRPDAGTNRMCTKLHDRLLCCARSTAIIWARIDTAISAGVFALISRPAGP